MYLKSFGCSFIFGNELPDDGWGTEYATASHMTWPARIARHKNLNYHCLARPGSGNLQILTAVLEAAALDPTAYFVVGWTWIDRFDYNDPHTTKWTTIMPNDKTELAKTYYKNIHSQYRDKLTTLLYIKSAIDTLKSKNINFTMTYMDDLILDVKYHTPSHILELQEYVRPYLTAFDGMTFLEWSRYNNYPVSDLWHPLVEAHEAGAQYLIDHNLV